MEVTCLLQPRDPLLVRDGRPFSADPGSQARTLEWPLPSTVAGAVRTHLGNLNNFEWSGDGPDKARSIALRGPLMLVQRAGSGWEYYFSAPADAVVYKTESEVITVARLSPFKPDADAGCNVPKGLSPLSVNEEFKPELGYDYWSGSDCVAWLSGKMEKPPENAMGKLAKDTRVHVRMNKNSGAHEQGGLFATESICMPDAQVKSDKPMVAMACRVCGEIDNMGEAGSFITLGGEGRSSHIESEACAWPDCPEELKSAASGKLLKLQLVTPGLFERGWLPAWIDRGTIPGVDGVKVKQIVSAAVPRRIPVSGWSYEKKTFGPKAARYACPAGTVFFLELETDLTPVVFERLWLSSICDIDQDNLDGFGLAIPGIWDYTS